MSRIECRGRTALVTGASSGLGADFARDLAARGANLVIVARRDDKLTLLADEICTAHGVDIKAIPMDLGTERAPQELHRQLTEAGLAVDFLVNNAGFGVYGDFLTLDWERENAMLQLDMVTLTHLSKLFGRDMAERGSGAMLQIASTGAFQPSPGYASYAAAKAYVKSFSYAIDHEMRPRGVTSTVLSPGVTATEFLQVSGQRRNWFHKLTMMQSPAVARVGIDAMLARRKGVVAGWMNKLAAHSNRMNPTAVSTGIAAVAMKN